MFTRPKRTDPVAAVLMAAILCFCLLSAGGCSTPIEKAYTVSSLYSAAQNELLNLKPPAIPQDAFDAAVEANRVAAPLVTEMNNAAILAEDEKLPMSKTFNFNKAFDAAKQAVLIFQQRISQARTRKTQ